MIKNLATVTDFVAKIVTAIIFIVIFSKHWNLTMILNE